jgi:molybdopterin-containing oxidoreductase family iron-sulfur binding subunit
MKKIDRRDFVKSVAALGAAGAAAVVGLSLPVARVNENATAGERSADAEPSRKWIMVIDLSKCDGCDQCSVSCKDEHYLPTGHDWLKVYETENALGGKYYLPRPCMHCENAPCVNVCPVGATYHNEEELVVVDNDRCIGCRFCMAACPYQARYFNWEEPDNNPPRDIADKHSPEFQLVHKKGTVGKCDFCSHRAHDGDLPACVVGCPMDAIYFGDLNEDAVTNKSGKTLSVSKVLAKRQAYKLKEDLGTEPSVYYLPTG